MSPSDRRIDGAEYASAHRHQMRCKLDHCVRSGHLRQQLLDFRCVAVMRYPVGFKAALHLSEEVRYVAGAARSGCAGFGIADDAVRHDPAFFLHQRHQAQEDACHKTTRIRDDCCILDRVAVPFGQTVDSFFQKFRLRVRDFVPFFIDRRILQSEIGSQIDDFFTFFFSFLGYRQRVSMRQSHKNNIAIRRHLFQIQFFASVINVAQQVRKKMLDLLTRIRTGGQMIQDHILAQSQ